jgi:predicted TIM-barrel fold metal-dependent hydrolase
MDNPAPGSQEWLDQIDEPIIDPHRPIIDPHHHLWRPSGALPYGPDDLVADTTSGHNVVATVFMECRSAYRSDGPEHLRCVGETEFVAASADYLTASVPQSPPIAGIVGHADLADGAHLDAVLDAHIEAAGGRFRGIRDALARATEPEVMMIPGAYAEGKSADPDFRRGVARLGERGLTYDTWHYHHQMHEILDLARAVPDTTIVLDHFGTPVGVGSYATKREEIFEQWKRDIDELATCQNVVAKIGGLAMPDNGFGWHIAERPPTSDEFVEAQGRYYVHTIEAFGPERCMFESNFPVDRFSLSYPVLYNGFKKIAAQYSDDEQDAMFAGTAARVYSIEV